MIVSQRYFTQRVVDAWHCLPGKAVAGEAVDGFIFELDRYLEALEIDVSIDIIAFYDVGTPLLADHVQEVLM